ncbi:MAG: hypothetical protein H0X64_06055 [Gemmatimonadaceae bacterium]|nr:hypothetical protein [Gemmatimonadaceae bacterium]
MAALSAVAAVAVACGESPVAPAAAKTGGLVPPSVTAMGPNFSLGLTNESRNTITIDPSVTAFYPVGPHWVYIPAGALCAEGTSYGVGEWDKDCVSATEKLTMDVSWGERDGRGIAEFHTDVRFKPTNEPLKAVYVYMQEQQLAMGKYAVLWRDATGVWVDEAKADKSLRAFRVNGVWVGRRLKHFSGYNVALGMHEEQSDPTAPGGAQ